MLRIERVLREGVSENAHAHDPIYVVEYAQIVL